VLLRPVNHRTLTATTVVGYHWTNTDGLTKCTLYGLVAGACCEQLANSKTAEMIWSRRPDIHQFPINNPSQDTDRYSPPAPRWLVKKTLPPTLLQIPATVTTLVSIWNVYPTSWPTFRDLWPRNGWDPLAHCDTLYENSAFSKFCWRSLLQSFFVWKHPAAKL